VHLVCACLAPGGFSTQHTGREVPCKPASRGPDEPPFIRSPTPRWKKRFTRENFVYQAVKRDSTIYSCVLVFHGVLSIVRLDAGKTSEPRLFCLTGDGGLGSVRDFPGGRTLLLIIPPHPPGSYVSCFFFSLLGELPLVNTVGLVAWRDT
jgi:hypothetical protein